MKIVSGFFVYRAYITYKSHFSSSKTDISDYDFRLFNPQYDTFLNTKGKCFFDKIAKKLKKEEEVVNLFISAFIDDPNVWIGDICLNLSHYRDLKDERENRIANISYTFRADCIHLLDIGMRFDNDMGDVVFGEFMMYSIELETFIIFKKIFNFSLDNNTNYDYIYKGKYEKYESLLKINTEKYKQILKEALMTFGD